MPHYDVFFSYNSKEKPAVTALAKRLREQGLTVWLDEWHLRPGSRWQDVLEGVIKTSHAAAILVGPSGIGPWQDQEMRSCLWQGRRAANALEKAFL